MNLPVDIRHRLPRMRQVTLDICSRHCSGIEGEPVQSEPFQNAGCQVSPPEDKLSLYQDAECSLSSESCWHNFDPDVRAICEPVLRLLGVVNESLDQRSGGATDSDACE